MQHQPTLFIVCGPSGAGKSTVARIIAKKFKIKIFSNDQIRRSKIFKDKTEPYVRKGKFFPNHLIPNELDLFYLTFKTLP